MSHRNFIASITFIAVAFLMVAASSPAAAGTVSCASYSSQRAICHADTRNGVAMTQQWSWRPCLKGRTWGVQGDNNIWVDQGCRAAFTTGVMPGNYDEPYAQNFTCESYGGQRNFCRAESRGEIRLVRQLSQAQCTRNSTWGSDQRGVWVDRGCRAVFSVTGQRAGYDDNNDNGNDGGESSKLTCASYSSERNDCPAPNHGSVRLSRQLSWVPCVQGTTWGFDSRGIWVDNGCRAEFEIDG